MDTVDLNAQLADYADWLERLLADEPNDLAAGDSHSSATPSRGRRLVWPLAAAATLIIVVAGLVAVDDRGTRNENPAAQAPRDVLPFTETFRLDMPGVLVVPAPTVALPVKDPDEQGFGRMTADREFVWADLDSSPVRYMALALSDAPIPEIEPPPSWTEITDVPDGRAWLVASEDQGDRVTHLAWRREGGQRVMLTASHLNWDSLSDWFFSTAPDGTPQATFDPNLALQPQADVTEPRYAEKWFLDASEMQALIWPDGLSRLLSQGFADVQPVTVAGRQGLQMGPKTADRASVIIVAWPLADGYWGVLSVPAALQSRIHEILANVVIETAPDTDRSAATTTVVGDFSDAANVLQPTDAYNTAVWTAREIVLGQCMARHGFEYRPRPIDASAGNAGTQWEAWFELQKSQHPTFEQTMLGGPDEQAGGCQLEAFQAVHGPGEEAYSKLNALYNEMLGDLPTDVDRSDANIAAWISQHRSALDAVHAELDEEQAVAQQVIDAA